MKTLNMSNDGIIEFDANTTAQWAVRYGYAQDHMLLSKLFRLQQDNNQEEIERSFPVVEGEKTVSCGDWGAFR